MALYLHILLVLQSLPCCSLGASNHDKVGRRSLYAPVPLSRAAEYSRLSFLQVNPTEHELVGLLLYCAERGTTSSRSSDTYPTEPRSNAGGIWTRPAEERGTFTRSRCVDFSDGESSPLLSYVGVPFLGFCSTCQKRPIPATVEGSFIANFVSAT